jgi:sugar O-acyltransferase (sialic acid O-acetyltransferase NeuD family)
MDRPVFIFGASGHGKVVADICRSVNLPVKGFIDSGLPIGTIVGRTGLSVIGNEELLNNGDSIIIAIGDNWTRTEIARRLKSRFSDLHFPSVVHPTATIPPSCLLGSGVVICAGVICGIEVEIGEFCLLNTGSSLDHESIMERGSSLAPGVIVAGNVTIGPLSAICLGAKIGHRVKIGKESVVGAGSVVLKNVTDNVVVYGIPAKMVRERKKEDRYL